MIPDTLSSEDRMSLLALARQAIHQAVSGEELEPIEVIKLSPCLQEVGTAFVTITIGGVLRGCIGGLEATRPLAEDVQEHAAAAALNDYRFHPLTFDEVDQIKIEISRLTPLQPVQYTSPDELLEFLTPFVDGVVVRDEYRRSTFLPQVWEKLPDPEDFLNHLCTKMGGPYDLWRIKPLQVWIYQVEEFHE
jgi:uncharacterized protein